jgi:hypothetical protein
MPSWWTREAGQYGAKRSKKAVTAMENRRRSKTKKKEKGRLTAARTCESTWPSARATARPHLLLLPPPTMMITMEEEKQQQLEEVFGVKKTLIGITSLSGGRR